MFVQLSEAGYHGELGWIGFYHLALGVVPSWDVLGRREGRVMSTIYSSY